MLTGLEVEISRSTSCAAMSACLPSLILFGFLLVCSSLCFLPALALSLTGACAQTAVPRAKPSFFDSNDAYALLVLRAFKPNALLESSSYLIRVGFYLRLLRQGEPTALCVSPRKGWFCCFCLVGCGFFVVWLLVFLLWFGFLGRFTEPAFHPLLVAIRWCDLFSLVKNVCFLAAVLEPTVFYLG